MATAISSSSSPWAKPGAWALDSEEHEDELKQPPPTTDFPSLSAAVTTTSKPKKKSKQTLSLAEFSNYKPPSSSSNTPIDVVLPTGPRERTEEEILESRRRGFRNYGGGGGGDRDRERERPSFGGGDRDMGPSRADEADDWGKGKKVSSFGSGGGVERDMGPSRADGADDWSKGKKFGSGFGERREKVGFFNSSRADEVDNWGAKKGFGSGSGSSFGEDRRRERRVGFEATGPGRDVDSWVKGKENGSASAGGSSGGGGSRPKLNLQPRTLPIEAIKVESNDVVSDNGDGNVNGNGNGNVSGEEKEKEVVKVKSNPFGAARPREEVLKEKGKDWKEIDEKLESVKVKEVERSSFDSIGKRRGVSVGGRSDGEDVKSIGAWRKPDSPSYANVVAAAAATTAPPQSGEAMEKNVVLETAEKAAEDN